MIDNLEKQKVDLEQQILGKIIDTQETPYGMFIPKITFRYKYSAALQKNCLPYQEAIEMNKLKIKELQQKDIDSGKAEKEEVRLLAFKPKEEN